MKELKSIWGRKLDNKDIKKRVKSYLFESLIFSLVMALIDTLGILISKNKAVFYFFDNYIINFIITVLITFLLLFVISFIFNYLVTEKNNKK